LFGGEEVFEKARKLCRGYDEKYALEYLEDLYGTLKKQNLHTNIIIDLGQVLKTDYYSGMVFSGYADGHGDAIITGGRYDRLMEAFDMPMGAAGFAVDVSAVTQIVLGGKTNSSKDNNTAAPIRIALTKGRLEKDTVALFKQLNYNVEEIENKGRKLILKVSKCDRVFEIVLAKAPDVITYVENGVCDLGVVGKDTILENGTIFYELYDLGFGICKFALASKVGEDFYSGYNIKTIATKYPVVARKFFESKNMDVKIIKIEGSVELAPLVGLADAIVDIVETGSTLKENGLEVIEEITPISARLISNIASLKLRKNEIEAFVDEIVGVLR
jgi:ATP phosphoribosyltransferase regulatory subunit